MKFYNKTQRWKRKPSFIDIRAKYDNCFRKKKCHLITLPGW